MSTTYFDGVAFADTDAVGSNGYGYNNPVTLSDGNTYPWFYGLLLAAKRDLGKALSAASATSVAIGSGSKTFTLTENIPFTTGAFVVAARNSAPTTTYMFGQVTAYNSTTKVLTINVGASEYVGSGTYTDWSISISGKNSQGSPGADGALGLTYTARSSDTVLGLADDGKAFVATSAFTQTLTAAATLGAGWAVVYKNNSAGAVIIDPNGSETINGSTTLRLAPKESVLLFCDGSNFHILSSHMPKPTGNGNFPNATGAITIDCAIYPSGSVYSLTATGNVTITLSNLPASGIFYDILIAVKQDGTGSRTVTINNTVGTITTASTTASKTDFYQLGCFDGTNLFIIGERIGQ